MFTQDSCLKIDLTQLKFFILYFSCFISSFSYGFIYVLPLLISNVGGNTIHFGLLFSIAGIATLLFVGFSGYLAHRIGPYTVCALGMLLCFITFFILYIMNHIGFLFYSSGLFIGTGWSFYYAASPMILNSLVADHERGKYLSKMAAYVVLGTSIGPILSYFIMMQGYFVQQLFILPVILSLLAVMIFLIQSIIWNDHPKKTDTPSSEKNRSLPFFQIIKTEAKYPLIMVFLGGCIFSSMMNFQTIYAIKHQLNFSIYYFCYMLSVIFSRFMFSGILTRKNPMSATPYLLALMLLGIFLMILNTHHTLIYAVTAVILGISYGLVYPLIKTYAINITQPHWRHEVLAYFTLCYFAGVYGFPLIAGFFIKNYGYTCFLLIVVMIVSLDLLIGWWRSSQNCSLT